MAKSPCSSGSALVLYSRASCFASCTMFVPVERASLPQVLGLPVSLCPCGQAQDSLQHKLQCNSITERPYPEHFKICLLLIAMGQSTSLRAVPVGLDRSNSPRRTKDVDDDGFRHRKEAKHRAASDRHIRKVKGKPFSVSFRRPYIGMASRAPAHNKQATGFYGRPRALSFHRRHVRENKTPPRSDLRSTVDPTGGCDGCVKEKHASYAQSLALCIASQSDRRQYAVPAKLTHVQEAFADGSGYL